MAQEHTRAGRFQTSIGGLVLAAVVMAYFLGPLLRFANPVGVAAGGFLLGSGLFAHYQTFTVTKIDKNAKWVAYAFDLLGVLLLIVAFSYAMTSSGEFDRKCAELQRVMLDGGKQPIDGRAPAHDAFDALACRPQMP